MIKPYVMTNHAKERKSEFFPRVNLVKDFETVTNCSSEEIYDLKNTKAYKTIKKSKKDNIKFFKTKAGMYLIVEQRTQRNGKTRNFIITIIDLLNPMSSFMSHSFKRQMIRESHNLQETSKLSPLELRERKKIKTNGRKAKRKIKGQSNEAIHRVVDKLNERKDTNGFVFSSLDFHPMDGALMLSNANNMIQQRNQLLELAKKNTEALEQGSNDAIANSACKTLSVLNKIYLKNNLHRLLASQLRDGDAKICMLKEYSILIDSLTKSLSVVSKKGRLLKESRIDSAKNFLTLLLDFKGLSKEFDQSVALFGESVVDTQMNLIRKDIKKNNDIYAAPLRKAIRLIEDFNIDSREKELQKMKKAHDIIMDSGFIKLSANACFVD